MQPGVGGLEVEGAGPLMTQDCEEQEVKYDLKLCEIISCSPMGTEKWFAS